MITVHGIYGIFTCYSNDWIIKEIQSCGAFSRPEVCMILHFLMPGDTVLDIGAHIGTFSIPMKKKIGTAGRLFCFEANPDTFSLLLKNLEDNNLAAEVFNKGVSDQDGALYLVRKNLQKRYESTSDDPPLNTGADFLSKNEPTNSTDIVKVDSVKIDDIVPGPVHFIKMDVEGMEISVIKSARKTIDRDRPIIYSEYSEYYLRRAETDPADYIDFFQKRNYHFFMNVLSRKSADDSYTLVRVPNPKYIIGQVDFLLIPKESNRYPKDFIDWKFYKPYRFIFNRLRNFLSTIKQKVKHPLRQEKIK